MLSSPLVDVLKNRGISDLDRFLAPSSWNDLPSPFELEGMEPAVTQILHAIRSQRPMTIVGDYDCDGVLSTAILEATLLRLGAQPTVYLPHRDEGYGLSNEVVHRFSTHGTRFLITIDNGINAAGPVRLAERLGIGVVIVDHHHIETRAEATAVWSEQFCAAGIAVLLSWALLETAGASEIRCFLAGLSRLAAIASIADCVPLTGPTRTLTRIGLGELVHTRHAGLRKMLMMAGVHENEVPSSEQIAFRVAPRINAAGRVGHPNEALQMLNAVNPDRQVELALSLDSLNRERRKQEKEALEELLPMVPRDIPKALVIYGPHWKKGIAGILASRVRERYGVSSFVLVLDPRTGMAVGSGRSVEGFSLIDGLRSCQSVLHRFGGHNQAAGVTLTVENISAFQQQFESFVDLHPPSRTEEPAAEADLELESAGRSFHEQLRLLEPFGIGNPTPIFRIRDVTVRPASPGFAIVRQRNRELRARWPEPAMGSGTVLVALNGTSATIVRFHPE